MSGRANSNNTLLQNAKALWNAGRTEDALAAAWQAYDMAPHGPAEKRLVTRILRDVVQVPQEGRIAALQALASDPDVNPESVCLAGWRLLTERLAIFHGDAPEDIAARLEACDFALTLLVQDIVALKETEKVLTAVRRFLLLGPRWRDFPRLSAALIAQAALNGGAWPFDAVERAALADAGGFAHAYLPPRENIAEAAAFNDRVTRAVAAQYEGWPYPAWSRINSPKATTLAALVRDLDPDGPDAIATQADILIAGCGTGRQVAYDAKRFPQSRITAIDISASSLRYAASRCAAAGVGDIDFRLLDLHQCATLSRPFDAVMCTGVLHHLPDPEAGLAALAGVLKPGGVMHIMVYSKIARMRVLALRRMLADLMAQPMSDDLLREVRRRVLTGPNMPTLTAKDFYSLAGVHDLLMHRHEDPFEVPRIHRALDASRLALIHFGIPSNAVRARYHAEHDDPLQRDWDGWLKLERGNPALYMTMYDFWCRKG